MHVLGGEDRTSKRLRILENMGGLGSGWHRGSRYTVDRAFGVDIGWILRHNPIREGAWQGSMAWTVNGHQKGSTGYYLKRDAEKPTKIVITCQLDGEYFQDDLGLTHLPMPKGGYKTLLVCPYCQSRRASLFFGGFPRLCCRKCANYTYQSCQDSKKYSGILRYLAALMDEELRWDRSLRATIRNRDKCKQWRKRTGETRSDS